MANEGHTPADGGDTSGRDAHPVNSRTDELVVVKTDPFNAEAPLSALQEPRTPPELFYVRSHFAEPELEPATWRLEVAGAFERSLTLSLEDLRALPSHQVSATLECAGNDRSSFAPLPKGEPWGSGAVSTAIWSGTSLRSVLDRAGLRSSAVEILFEGADGTPEGPRYTDRSFDRALPIPTAMDPDTLIAFEQNHMPLQRTHGGPVRLIVPDWYGVASVKWLRRVVAIEQPFTGYFQTQRYILQRPGHSAHEPLTTMRVKSLMTAPLNGAILPPGRHRIAGMAWSGAGAITRVEISVKGEGRWHEARLLGEPIPHTWRRWEWEWEPSELGRYALRVRATDSQGNIQPDLAEWNRHGYANNSIQVVLVGVQD